MRLSLRLFLACAGLAAASLLAFLLWQLRTFESGFSGYLEALAVERAEFVAARLTDYHRSDVGWQRLRTNPMAFGRLVDPGAPGSPADRPGGPEARMFDGSPMRAPESSARPQRGAAPPFGPRLGDPGLRLALFDTTGSYVAGRRADSPATRALPVIDDGRIVGELRLYPGPRAPQGLDADFARQQQRSALWIGGTLLAAAAGLSLWLSRRLLHPIRALAGGARALAAGNYTQRVDVRGRDELAALAEDFNRLAQTLEHARETRRAFGADLAHELRTPLTILRGELQALQAGARPLDRAAIDSLLAETEQLGALTEDLNQLALSDAGALAYRFEPLQLDELLRDEEAHWRPRLQRSGLSLNVVVQGAPLWIRGDAVRLAQLLGNLLANAQRYTHAPGEVRLQARCEATCVVLDVDDSPPAVADEDLPRVFDRLFRTDRARAHGSGTGLGLAIVRAVAQAHDAAISARRSTLGGLCVEIRFPAGAPP